MIAIRKTSDRNAMLTLLRLAFDTISDPTHWTQGAIARDLLRNPVPAQSSNAFSYCSLGAVEHIRDQWQIKDRPFGAHGLVLKLLDDIAQKMGYDYISDLNDNGTHEDVVLMFKTAIAELEGE